MRERTKEIIEDYLNGLTREEICEKYNKDSKALRELLQYHKVKIWDNKKELKIDENLVLELYKEGNTQCSISKKMKIGRNTVRKILLKHNAIKYKVSEKRIYKLWREGNNAKEIGIQLGVKLGRVYNLIKKWQRQDNHYYNWRKDKDRYAKMIYEYNR